MQFAVSLLATQSFMPLYLKTFNDNFLDMETDRVAVMWIILFMALQLFVMKR